jgi:hypothetical protein
VSAAEKALAEARQAYADALQARRRIEARQSQIDNVAGELAAHLKWLRQNADAVWNLLTTRNNPRRMTNP